MRRRMIITTILLSLLLIVFLLLIGGFNISFHPFSIEFTRLYNMLGWLSIIACGIFFNLDHRLEQQKHYTKQLEEYQEYAQKKYLSSIKHLQDTLVTMCKEKDARIHELEVQLNNKQQFQEHGN